MKYGSIAMTAFVKERDLMKVAVIRTIRDETEVDSDEISSDDDDDEDLPDLEEIIR